MQSHSENPRKFGTETPDNLLVRVTVTGAVALLAIVVQYSGLAADDCRLRVEFVMSFFGFGAFSTPVGQLVGKCVCE